MKFVIKENDKFIEFCLKEKKLTAEIAPQFKAEIIVLADKEKSIICDLKNIEYVDSSGLSCFLIGDRLLKKINYKFILCNASESTKKLIKMTKLDSVLTLIPTFKEAKDFVIFDELEKSLK